MRTLRYSILCLPLALAVASPAAAQPSSTSRAARADLRQLHERAVYATVRIETQAGIRSGWLLAQSGRPLIITNYQGARDVGRLAGAFLYQGAGEDAVRVPVAEFHRSRSIDLGILRLLEDPPPTVRPVTLHVSTTVVRGERVVLAGNPADSVASALPFQSTEGVVTGHVSGEAYSRCGTGRNCVVVDAASFRGSSGGPVFNMQGRLVGMLWGGPRQRTRAGREHVAIPTFSFLIHVRVIAAELRQLQRTR